jgi:hypothetical protein
MRELERTVVSRNGDEAIRDTLLFVDHVPAKPKSHEATQAWRHKPLSQNAKVDKVVCSALVFVRCVLLKTVGDLSQVLEQNIRQFVAGAIGNLLKGYLSE